MPTWPASGNTDWNTKMLAYLAIGHDTDGTHNQEDSTPTTYTGGESVTFPNGYIQKRGTDTTYTGDISPGEKSGTVTFGTAFPNSCLTVICTVRDNNQARIVVSTNSIIAASFAFKIVEVLSGTQNMQGFDWFAIGY